MNATMMDSDKNGWGQRSHVLREEEESMSDVFLDETLKRIKPDPNIRVVGITRSSVLNTPLYELPKNLLWGDGRRTFC